MSHRGIKRSGLFSRFNFGFFYQAGSENANLKHFIHFSVFSNSCYFQQLAGNEAICFKSRWYIDIYRRKLSYCTISFKKEKKTLKHV